MYLLTYLLTYCPSCHRQLGQQQILSISGGLEPVSVRFPMNVPWLSPLLQQCVSMSSLDARDFCVPLVSIRLLLLGCSLDLCVIYGLSIFSVYVQLRFLYFFDGIHRKGTDLTLFEARRFLVWKDDTFDMSFSVMRQHSDPYSRVEMTQLLYNFNFVCVFCIAVISTRGSAPWRHSWPYQFCWWCSFLLLRKV